MKNKKIMRYLNVKREGSGKFENRLRQITFKINNNAELIINAGLDLTSNEMVEIKLTNEEKKQLIKLLIDGN